MKKLTMAEYLPIDKLKPFDGYPFYVKDDDDMDQLTESIRQQGVLKSNLKVLVFVHHCETPHIINNPPWSEHHP